MRIAYPRSLLKLLLFGFALAMLPLLFAFGNAAIYLDRLAEQSRITIAQAVQATRASRVLVVQITQMERSARQYFVLNEIALRDNYTQAHKTFAHSIAELSALPLTQKRRQALQKLAQREEALYLEILRQKPGIAGAQAAQTVISQFVDLSDQAQDILAQNNQLIDRESALLATTAQRTQQILLSHTLILIPVALLVAIVITYLVAQPVRNMDAAIRRLGEGRYSDPISIDGPGDLRALGERLDWLRAQLEQLEQQKQLFLRHVSHELKTPLTAIREGSELLNEEAAGLLNPQQREIVGILRENSLRLQKMIENLLSYSAVQFRKPELMLENVDLGKLVNAAIESYALTMRSKQIQIYRDFMPISVQGDSAKLHTVIDNLLSNAMKYTPQAGKIRVSIKQRINTKNPAQSVMIEVHDDGPGISAADRDRLFQPFYRGSGVYESLISGSGLGLSIAREYVSAHGGKIAVLPSEHGARFVVRLPLKPISEVA